jgi:hypothetical protein
MKPRHFLVRIAAFVTAAAAIAMFLGPARADASDHDDPDGTVHQDSSSGTADDGGTLLEGWANRDDDIGNFSTATAEELGSRLDGWDTPDMDLNPTALWEAMAFGIGSILDGWGNRDMDIGTFASAADNSPRILDRLGTRNDGLVLGSNW